MVAKPQKAKALERPANAEVHRVAINIGAQAIHAEAGATGQLKLEAQAGRDVVAHPNAVGNGSAIQRGGAGGRPFGVRRLSPRPTPACRTPTANCAS